MSLEVVNINNISKGDILLFEGAQFENQITIITVESVTDEGLIIPKELGGVDICPEDMDCIVRIGTDKIRPVITLLAEKMDLALSQNWRKEIS